MPLHRPFFRRRIALMAVLTPFAALAWIPDGANPVGDHAGPRHMHIPLAIDERLENAATTLAALLTAHDDAGEPSPLVGARGIQAYGATKEGTRPERHSAASEARLLEWGCPARQRSRPRWTAQPDRGGASISPSRRGSCPRYRDSSRTAR